MRTQPPKVGFGFGFTEGMPFGFGDTPDMSKLIKLESSFNKAQDMTGHLVVDVFPGNGKFEGKAVLTLHFGTMHLAGALS